MSCCCTCLWVLLSLTAIAALGYKYNKKVRYNVKYIIFMTYTFFSTIVFVPFMIHKGQHHSNGLMPAWGVRTCTRLILGLTWEVKGQQNILPEGEGCVVAINHQSSLDIVLMTYIWPYVSNGFTVIKREVFWIYPFPWYWNTVFIDKLNPEKAQNDINSTGDLITSKKARICMFPEGTRHDSDTLLPFKKGAFHIALKAQCPIQPVVCSKYHFLDHKTHRFDNKGHSVIEFLPPIPTKGMTKEQLPELMEKVRSVMQVAFTRISAEQEKKNQTSKKKR